MNRSYRLTRFGWQLPLWVGLVIGLFACGANNDLPINQLRRTLQNMDNYSIILEDMKVDGNFFKTYYHKYRVVQNTEKWATDWMEVPRNYYMTNETFLGMTLVSRVDGKENSTVSPPGYAYVGDSRYGRWQTDRSGNSFWAFYGKYRMFSDLFGGWYRPVYRTDYNRYSTYRSRHAPYFGRNHQFGTLGTVAKKEKPSFFARRMRRLQQKKMSFADRVSKRIGRTRSHFRGRAGGFGK